MGITYSDINNSFHLFTKETSYVIQVVNNKYLMHCYWGKKIKNITPSERLIAIEDFNSFSPNPDFEDKSFSFDTMPREYPDYGKSDYRQPAYRVLQANGSSITDAIYDSYKIYEGKNEIKGLPYVYTEEKDNVHTLEITLKDEVCNLDIILIYNVFEDYNVITRSVRFENKGQENLLIDGAASMSLDFYNDSDFEVINLAGAWARERHMIRTPLGVGMYLIDSKRGASSHNQNPFLALVREETNEQLGEAYGINLVYSGNFKAFAEVGPYNSTRLSIGINDFDFQWNLEIDKTFETPEVVMVYSDKGLNKLSQTYHKIYRERLCKGSYRDKERPVLINNWEATYFEFTEEKIKEIIGASAELGIELFVLDDGWFGVRNSDESGLGDWFENREKLPNGLKGLAQYCNDKSMKFGLWFEPEMISPDSELYKINPDWCLHVPNRQRTEGRNQLVLDLSRQDVCDYIIDVITKVLGSTNIQYVKWDMNRSMTEVGSALLEKHQQRETAHRYILGLYHVIDTITSSFPDILFESCAGGGGRFDPGMLYYMPQTWTSDDTDAYERVLIQYGTSLCYPLVAMGSHVSEVPNHQVIRTTDIQMRADVAMVANLGYELDVTNFSEQEKEVVKNQIIKYKGIRRDIQFGTFYRLINPFKNNRGAWMTVSEGEERAIVFYYRFLKKPNSPMYRLKLQGLEEAAAYKCDLDGQIYYGDELMYRGISIPHMNGDFLSQMFMLEKV